MNARALILMVLCSAVLHASEAQLKDGNRLFWKGNYEEALKKYNDALIDAPNSSVLRFNAGDAAYQMGNVTEAERQFKEAGERTTDPGLRAASLYNQGNALFRQNRWKEAVETYKNSLRVNPNDQDAKYNLGVALDVMHNPSKAPAQPKPDKNSGNKKEKAKPKDAQPKPGDMSKEDAERLLAAAGAGEPKKPNAKAPQGGVPHPDEDW